MALNEKRKIMQRASQSIVYPLSRRMCGSQRIKYPGDRRGNESNNESISHQRKQPVASAAAG